MNGSDFGLPDRRAQFEQLLGELRPKLHRHCARMVGSVIDGEDVVQESLVKATEALSQAPAIASLDGWLFRIAHNTALDWLRRKQRQQNFGGEEDMAMIADPIDRLHQRQAAAASLRTFMRLSVAQRSSVVLMDVLGYSLDEVGEITGGSIGAVKAALHRGRERLRTISAEPDDASPPALSEAERQRLSIYVDRFNARDFDAVRDMLADDVRLELVSKTRMTGRKEVSRYFGNYANVYDWYLQPGLVDRRPAIVVSDPGDGLGDPTYFVLLRWAEERIIEIRDFRHARYAIEAAETIADV
jgi:RNA polymerase sigma-70 factor (ECF subfamily)